MFIEGSTRTKEFYGNLRAGTIDALRAISGSKGQYKAMAKGSFQFCVANEVSDGRITAQEAAEILRDNGCYGPKGKKAIKDKAMT